MNCQSCDAVLQGIDDIRLYAKTDVEVHLVLRPERMVLDSSRSKEIYKQPNPNKNHIKIASCRNCRSIIGQRFPVGPRRADFVAFASNKVKMLGRQLSCKAMWKLIR